MRHLPAIGSLLAPVTMPSTPTTSTTILTPRTLIQVYESLTLQIQAGVREANAVITVEGTLEQWKDSNSNYSLIYGVPLRGESSDVVYLNIPKALMAAANVGVDDRVRVTGRIVTYLSRKVL